MPLTEAAIGAPEGRVAAVELRLSAAPPGDGSEWDSVKWPKEPQMAPRGSKGPLRALWAYDFLCLPSPVVPTRGL